ncbi:MAG: PEP-CTERM sorting domain-containing protein [Rubrivivax sp.]|nr:PEP-CTERM sorting domain-containing protein [Rubrivivax sp.]
MKMAKFSKFGLSVIAGSALFAMQASAGIITPGNPLGWAGYTYYGSTGTDPGTGASAAITGTYARSGNGSAQLHLDDNLQSEADWAMTFGGNASYGLSSLSALSYDWYRSSTSTTNGIVAPSFALGMTDGTYLIYEYAYNHTGNPVADVWTTENILDGIWWSTGNGTGSCARYGAFTTLSAFNTNCFSGDGSFDTLDMFMGYAYSGTFDGAVDNVVMTVVGGPSLNANFELDQTSVVPEPVSFALVAAGLLGIVAIRRRKR